MKYVEYKAELKDGRVAEGIIGEPENLKELLAVYPEQRVFLLGLQEYMKKAKKRLVTKRSPKITFRLADLTVEQQAALRKLGLLDRG